MVGCRAILAWQTTTEVLWIMVPIDGFVALLDVLGFSNLVTGPSSQLQLQQYLDAIEQATDEKSGVRGVNFILFSDSIVISTKEQHDIALRILLRTCSRAFGLLLEKRIAVRGAIAHGQYFREATESGTFIAGRPIVDAYDFEKKQDWVGIMIHSSVFQAKPELAKWCKMPTNKLPASDYESRLPWIVLAQENHQIPFHGAPGQPRDYDGFAVVPTVAGSALGPQWAYLGTCIESLNYMKSLAPDPSAQRKYNATLDWLNDVRSRWKDLARAHDFPSDVTYY